MKLAVQVLSSLTSDASRSVVGVSGHEIPHH